MAMWPSGFGTACALLFAWSSDERDWSVAEEGGCVEVGACRLASWAAM